MNATPYNRKCVRFNSRVWFPDTEAVDSFSVCWAGEMNWIVPPPRLINAVLDKLATDGAVGVLVVPIWKSAPFWPILFPDGRLANFISGSENFSTSGNIMPGRGRNGVFSGHSKPFNMMAALCDFS